VSETRTYRVSLVSKDSSRAVDVFYKYRGEQLLRDDAVETVRADGGVQRGAVVEGVGRHPPRPAHVEAYEQLAPLGVRPLPVPAAVEFSFAT
jgi:hypothetical protein